jgi:hypothetical protein
MSNTLKLGNGQWATGKDTVLAYNDLNSNYKPLAFSFSRNSSATVVNKDGLIETVGSGEPRIDFKDNTKGALLLEPSRSNKIPYSQDFTKSNWQTSGSIVKEGNTSDILALDGTQSVGKLTFYGTGYLNEQFIPITSGSSSTYTVSFYLKGTVGETLNSYMDTVAGDYDFSQTNITLTGDWQRVSYSINTSANNVGVNVIVRKQSSDTVNTVYIWGAQLEQGSYATSYIPTSGQANGVTRVAESCYQGGLLDKGILNNNAMTLYFENDNQSDTSNNYLETISLYNDLNNIGLRLETRTNNQLYVQQSGVVSSGSNFNSFSLGVNSVNLKKIAIYLTTTQFKVFADGNQIYSTYNGTYVLNFNNISFRQNNGSVETKIQNKEIKLYNTALTDAELIALTKI